MAGFLNDLHAFRLEADGTAGPFDFVATRGWLVLDQIVSSNATVGGATVRLQRSAAATPAAFNPVGDATSAATVDDVRYVAENVDAQITFSTGDTFRMVVVNLAQADLIVEVEPTTWVAG